MTFERRLLKQVSQQRVLCAMSGGVDSSAAALYLLQKGYYVEGVTMRLFEAPKTNPINKNEQKDKSASSSNTQSSSFSQEIIDAKEVCQQLGIKHTVLDYRKEFSQHVIERFCHDYLSGKTPNPCIECNRHLKFGALHHYRATHGFDFLATGHYAQIFYQKETGRFGIKKASSLAKDQSYVLYHMSQDELAHTLFPLDSLSKEEARSLASQAGLKVAHKAESQDICFIPQGNYVEFLLRKTPHTPKPGPITLSNGSILGEHTGLISYTIGQRKGIGIGYPEPLYVLKKDYEHNTLIVGTAAEKSISSVSAHNLNFVGIDAWEGPLCSSHIISHHTQSSSLKDPLLITAKTHYRQKPQTGYAFLKDNILTINFIEPSSPTAPGQSLVVYKEDQVLCGGTII